MTCTIHLRAKATLAAALAAAVCLAPAAAPTALAQGSDANTAVAVNDKDGSSVFDVAFQIRRVSSGVVDQTNAAVSYASCESCQTVAIAIQIVLVSGGADTITPTNLAVAINEECTTCQTLALAYQFVFGTGDILGFTPEGQKRLNDIRKELRRLGDEGLTNDEISARVLDLTDQIRDVLINDVIVRGPGQQGKPDQTAPDEAGLTVPEKSEPVPEEDLPQEDYEQPVPPPEGEDGETQTTSPTEEPVPPESPQTTTAP
jgi:putative peptide zinc metalloprotease protein